MLEPDTGASMIVPARASADVAARNRDALPATLAHDGGVSPNRRNFRRALPGASISPEVLEPIRREFGIAGGVLDVAVAQVMLDRPCVLPVVGQLIAGGVP